MEGKFEVAKQLISALLNVNAFTFLKNNSEVYASFSQTLFLPHQVFPSSSAFGDFLHSLKEKTLCHLTDHLRVSYCFVTVESWVLMVGPYLNSPIKKYDAKIILEENRLPDSILSELVMYFNSVKILDKSTLILAVQTLLRSLYPDLSEAAQVEISLKGKLSDTLYETTQREIAAEYVNRTFSVEAQFMEMIMQGNANEAKRLIRIMSKRIDATLEQNENPAMALSTFREGHAIARTLTRLAAKNTGVSSSPLNAITNADRIASMKAKSVEEINRILYQTIDDVCTLVTQNRLMKCSPIVKTTIQYVLPNLGNSLSVKSIAEQVDVSANYLSGVFKAETGLTLTEYIRKHRLESAANYLLYTAMPIQEICSIVGIPDNNYFTKLFKKQFGESPSTYQQAVKNSR